MSTTGGGGGIRRVDPVKRTGVILMDGSREEVVFDFSSLEGNFEPRVGQRVEFAAELKSGRLTATRVALNR